MNISAPIVIPAAWTLVYDSTTRGSATLFVQVIGGDDVLIKSAPSTPSDDSSAVRVNNKQTSISLASGSSEKLYARSIGGSSTILTSADSQQVTIAQSQSAVTDKSGTITAGGTAQTAIAANTARVGYSIQNTSTGVLWFSGVGTAAANGSSMILLPNGYYETPLNAKNTGAVSIFGATTGQSFAAREW